MLKHLILHGDGEKEISRHHSPCGSKIAPFVYTSHAASNDINSGVYTGLPSGLQAFFSWAYSWLGVIRVK